MANEKIGSKGVGFYVNMAPSPGTETYESNPDWELLACTTSKGFQSSLGTIATASDCDEEGYSSVEPGDITWSFRNSFFAVKNVDSGSVSGITISSVHKAREKRQFKLESIDDFGASFHIMGYGLISELSLNVDSGNYMTGEMTVTGIGPYEDEAQGS